MASRSYPSSFAILLVSSLALCVLWSLTAPKAHFKPILSQREAQLRNDARDRCRYISTPAGPPPDFEMRTESDRFDHGTPPVLIVDATIWTGEHNGTEVIRGDILLDKGLIRAIGSIPSELLQSFGPSLRTVAAYGTWLTPALVDLHSHIGVGSSPHLSGASDTNSRKAPILPWLRSIDGLNTHDASYELARAGGVGTVQVLPGSANDIGGQAVVIKLRDTEERSTTARVLEMPDALNGTKVRGDSTMRWRHMKHACGENPSRVYSQTRMDSGWEFRNAYDTARKIRDAQDAFCAKVEAGRWSEVDVERFPEELQWEALVDVLRGKVKVSIHCYEAVDLDMVVRLSNEFKFPIASFHHGGETYLVPKLLKQAWGGTPSIALFASNARKKREACRGSEFAPRVLAEHNIPVVMKSDHPVVNSRYLLNEAAMAHHYGLDAALALGSVTRAPADAMGMGHRIGRVRIGNDADIVLWDSHPLSLGAAPQQVYIDGIPQLASPSVSTKPKSMQHAPTQPDFDHEMEETVRFEGLPPLEPRLRLSETQDVVFVNVRSVNLNAKEVKCAEGLRREAKGEEMISVLVRNGSITCFSFGEGCRRASAEGNSEAEVIDLKGGALAPGLTTFGSPLGLVEIRLEQSTNDGSVYDTLGEKGEKGVPVLVREETLIRALDGLQLGGRNTLLAYRGGVTTAIAFPTGSGVILGISTAFTLGALDAFERGAVVQKEVALHVQVSRSLKQSVSTQVALLRRLLFRGQELDSNSILENGTVSDNSFFKLVRKGERPLVVHVENADIMASLLALKHKYEFTTGEILRVTFAGAAEAHLIAREISQAGVSVIISPIRPFPGIWDQRRILPGPPLSEENAISVLVKNNVNVAVGVVDEYTARNTRFDIAWAVLESHGEIGEKQAISLATTNLEKALGLNLRGVRDIVAYKGGGMTELSSKVAAVISPARRTVDLF